MGHPVITMAARDETPPPRVRRRPKAMEQVHDLLRDLSLRVEHDDLPEGDADRLRVLVAQRDPEVMDWLFDQMWKLRLAGQTHFDIARRFSMHVQTSKKYWRLAQEWATRRHTKLDPGRHFAERMHQYKVWEARLNTMIMNTTDPKESAMLMAAAVRLDTNRRTWLEKHKYFDLFPFGRIQKGDDAARQTSEDVVKDMDWAFTGDGPVEGETDFEDLHTMPLLDEDDFDPRDDE